MFAKEVRDDPEAGHEFGTAGCPSQVPGRSQQPLGGPLAQREAARAEVLRLDQEREGWSGRQGACSLLRGGSGG